MLRITYIDEKAGMHINTRTSQETGEQIAQMAFSSAQ
jgi:hypothetical protein